MLPKFRWDRERMKVTASWERGRRTSTQSTRDDKKKTSLEIQKGLSMEFVATQEATASCWSGSKTRWKDLLCQDLVGRRRVVFKAFVLNPFPAADITFLYFQNNAICAELKLGGKHSGIFWCAPLKNFLADTGKFRVPSQKHVQILYTSVLWLPTSISPIASKSLSWAHKALHYSNPTFARFALLA